MNEHILLTARLKLRFVDTVDIDFIHELLSFPEIDKYNTAGIPENPDISRGIINGWLHERAQGQLFPFVIKLGQTGEMLGMISLRLGKPRYRRAEVSYKIHPRFWRNGYATEALMALIDFGFNGLNLHRIEAGCAVDNIASVRVLEKSGMLREGRCRQLLPLAGGWSDNFEYAILESDFR